MNLIPFLEYLTWCQKKQLVHIAQYKSVIWSSHWSHQKYSRFCVMFRERSELFILQWTYVYLRNNTGYNISQNYYPGINYQQNIVLFCTLKYLRRMKIFYFLYCLQNILSDFKTLKHSIYYKYITFNNVDNQPLFLRNTSTNYILQNWLSPWYNCCSIYLYSV